MTPGLVIRSILTGLSLAAPILPGGIGAAVRRAVDVLDDLPGIVDELGDGTWSTDDVAALRQGVASALAEIPGLPDEHAADLARGIVACVDLIRSAVAGVKAKGRDLRPGRVRRAVVEAKRRRAFPADSVAPRTVPPVLR